MKKLVINKNNLELKDINEFVYRPRAIIINSNNEILLGFCNNTYQFPGGFLEDNETLIEGLKREILEETGILLNDKEIIKMQMCDVKKISGGLSSQELNIVLEIQEAIKHKELIPYMSGNKKEDKKNE